MPASSTSTTSASPSVPPRRTRINATPTETSGGFMQCCTLLVLRVLRRCYCSLPYLQLMWSFACIMIACYAYARYEWFQQMMIGCVMQAPSIQEEASFNKHHAFRVAFLLVYAISSALYCLMRIYTSPESGLPLKVMQGLSGLVASIVCVTGLVLVFVWPIHLRGDLPTCGFGSFMLWTYRAWPWYVITLLLVTIFVVVRLIGQCCW